MTATAIFWPMIAHAALVIALYLLLALRRQEAVKAGDAKTSQFRENRDEPQQSLFIRNNLANQFELPVLFHAVCLALYATGGASTFAVVLAWLFVLSRYAHSLVHVTTNRIRHRRPAFSAGFVVVVLMWALLAFNLAAA